MIIFATVVIWCGACCFVRCSAENGRHFATWIRTANDGINDDDLYSFEPILSVSLKKCFEACKSTKACQYVNYDVRSRTCYLIRANGTPPIRGDGLPSAIEEKPGYVLGIKSQWMQAEIGPCVSCNDRGACGMNAGTTHYSECRNSGCGLPPSYGFSKFKSNIFSYGSQVLYTCDKDYQLFQPNNATPVSMASTCLENGSWSLVKFICVPGFTIIKDNSLYYRNTESMSWQLAENECAKNNGHLVSINDEEEQNLIKQNFAGRFWSGGKWSSEGSFVWPDGSAFGYTIWNSGRIFVMEAEQCVFVGIQYKWSTRACSDQHEGVCEISYLWN